MYFQVYEIYKTYGRYNLVMVKSIKLKFKTLCTPGCQQTFSIIRNVGISRDQAFSININI